MEINYWNI